MSEQVFYGTKRVTAWPEERDGQLGYGVRYADGYTSWSPREPFEAAYRPAFAMNFDHALQAMREGYKVARAHWIPVGCWLAISADRPKPPPAGCYFGHPAQTVLETAQLIPHIVFRNPHGNVAMSWFGPSADLLAEDWSIVDEAAPPHV